MSANNTDVLVSNETNTTSSNNELNKTSTDSKTNSTNSGNSQAEKRPHDNSGSYFNRLFHNKWVDIFPEEAFLIAFSQDIHKIF